MALRYCLPKTGPKAMSRNIERHNYDGNKREKRKGKCQNNRDIIEPFCKTYDKWFSPTN